MNRHKGIEHAVNYGHDNRDLLMVDVNSYQADTAIDVELSSARRNSLRLRISQCATFVSTTRLPENPGIVLGRRLGAQATPPGILKSTVTFRTSFNVESFDGY